MVQPLDPNLVSVAFTVQGVERVRRRGRLLALATVVFDLAGVELTLQGIRVMRDEEGSLTVHAPVWRHPDSGKWVPGVLLPPELSKAIGDELLESYRVHGGLNAQP